MMTLSAILMAQGLNGQVWLELECMSKPMGRTHSYPWSSHLHLPGWIFTLWTCAKLESLLFRNNCSTAICSDSLAAIKAVSAYKVTTGLVAADAITELKALRTFNSVRLIWVPGHCGIAGNEKVDMLAKQASSSCFTGPEPSVDISVSTIYSYISSWAVCEQNRLWHELSGKTS